MLRRIVPITPTYGINECYIKREGFYRNLNKYTSRKNDSFMKRASIALSKSERMTKSRSRKINVLIMI